MILSGFWSADCWVIKSGPGVLREVAEALLEAEIALPWLLERGEDALCALSNTTGASRMGKMGRNRMPQL